MGLRSHHESSRPEARTWSNNWTFSILAAISSAVRAGPDRKRRVGRSCSDQTWRIPSAERRFRRGQRRCLGDVSTDTLHSCRCCTLSSAYEADRVLVQVSEQYSNIPLGSAPAARRVATFRGRHASTRGEL